MKSAYELAMERLQGDDPQDRPAVTEEQKQALAEIDRKYAAKIAEREVFLQSKLAAYKRQHDAESVTQLKEQLINERKRLEEERDRAKDKLRAGQA